MGERLLDMSQVREWLSSRSIVTKVVIFGTSVAAGVVAYRVVRNALARRKSYVDEGFAEASLLEDQEPKEHKVLVVGPVGSGKSTLVSALANLKDGSSGDIMEGVPLQLPTKGLNVVCMHAHGLALSIWDLGGDDSINQYWGNYLQETDLLVFVVDSASSRHLPVAVKLFRELMEQERLRGVPILLVASKQDQPNAMKPSLLAEALGVNEMMISRRNRVSVLGTRAVGEGRSESLAGFKSLVVGLTNKKDR